MPASFQMTWMLRIILGNRTNAFVNSARRVISASPTIVATKKKRRTLTIAAARAVMSPQSWQRASRSSKYSSVELLQSSQNGPWYPGMQYPLPSWPASRPPWHGLQLPFALQRCVSVVAAE
eukprot:6167397-Prymnesium_polylepis.2